MATHKDLKLPDPFPSAPHRAASIVMRFRSPEDRNNTDHLWVIGFNELYAAKVFFDSVFGTKYKWLSELEVQASNTIMKCEDIDTIVNYKLKNKEKEWTLPEPYMGYANSIREGKRLRIEGEKHPKRSENTAKDKPKDAPKTRQRTPNGLVSIAAIASDLGIDTREARAILRKSTIKKPQGGWAFEPDQVEEVKKVIKKGMK